MVYPKHIREHHAIGVSRTKACISYCLFPPTLKGTIFSNRFLTLNKDFDNLLEKLKTSKDN